MHTVFGPQFWGREVTNFATTSGNLWALLLVSNMRAAMRRRGTLASGARRSHHRCCGARVVHGAQCAGAPVWEWCMVQGALVWEWRMVQSARALRCGRCARCRVRRRSGVGVVHGAQCAGAPVREWCNFSVWLQGKHFLVRVAHTGVRRALLCESGATFQCGCKGSVSV